MKDRLNEILAYLTKENKMEVTELSEKLNVSKVTIRKDLDILEKRGIIHREHGYAILSSPDDINGRIAWHYEEKKRIAKKASELVHDGDTIMIESGSCCALLADALCETKKDITIITNSAFIAQYIRGKSNFEIILTGGIYQMDAQVMVGPLVRQTVENFYTDLFFIGTDGYTERTGFTNKDQMRAQAVRDMAKQAENVVVLTESVKFGKQGVVPLNLKGAIKTVITDDEIPEQYKEEIKAQGIHVII